MAVTATDLRRITLLYRERRDITAALEIFDAGGRIQAMTIAIAPDPDAEEAGRSQRVMTDWMTYPGPMVDAIKAQFAQRRQAIDTELSGMGIDMAAPEAAARR